MPNLVSAQCVGDYFLLQTDLNAGDTLSNLKLQKLCYYAQAWHVAQTDGAPLFTDKIKAWAHGPVVPVLWHRFKECRWSSIDPSATISNPFVDLHQDHLETLEMVWNVYSPFSGKQLEILTHSEDPWRDAYGDRPIGARCDEEITTESMRVFYRRRLAAA